MGYKVVQTEPRILCLVKTDYLPVSRRRGAGSQGASRQGVTITMESESRRREPGDLSSLCRILARLLCKNEGQVICLVQSETSIQVT